MRRESLRKILGVGTSIFVAITLAVSLSGCGHSEDTPVTLGTSKTVRAEVRTVSPSQEPGVYVAAGTVKSQLNTTLSSKVMGRVVGVLVHEGDEFKQGQPLVSLDARELSAAVHVAEAGYRSSVVGVDAARTAADMEAKTSAARIAQAESQVQQAEAGLAAAEAHRDLALAGPRRQEVAQSTIAVQQAESNMKLAKAELDRTRKLVEVGALAGRQLDVAQNRYDVAKGQFEAARQSENMAREGSRSEEIRAAREAVSQAQGAIRQAKAGLVQARAAGLQTQVRRKEVEVARAQAQQASAASESARVSLSYARVEAPFDGRVVQRLVDPGAMASPGAPLLNVEGAAFRLEVVVPESVLKSVSVGQKAMVLIDALPGKNLVGRIVEIVPQANAATHSFLVKLELQPLPGLKSGMYGKARIRTGAGSKLLIPRGATWEREGLQYVFAVDKDGIARLRIVTLGDFSGDRVEVLSGLAAGDRIVAGNREEVSDGNKVEAK